MLSAFARRMINCKVQQINELTINPKTKLQGSLYSASKKVSLFSVSLSYPLDNNIENFKVQEKSGSIRLLVQIFYFTQMEFGFFKLPAGAKSFAFRKKHHQCKKNRLHWLWDHLPMRFTLRGTLFNNILLCDRRRPLKCRRVAATS